MSQQVPRGLILVSGLFTLATLYIAGETLDALDKMDSGSRKISVGAFETLLIALPLLGYLAFIAWTYLKRHFPDQTSTPHRRFGWLWLGVSVIALVMVAGMNFYTNPRGYYETDFYPPHSVDARKLKLDLYDEVETSPEILILGSSRAFTVSPQHIQDSLGFTAFNASVEAGRMDDMVILADYFLDNSPEPPAVILVEALPGFLSEDVSAAKWTLDMLPYLPLDLKIESVRQRIENLFAAQQLAEALYTIQAKPSKLVWEFAPDGSGVNTLHLASQDLLAQDLDNTQEVGCGRKRFDEWAAYTDQLIDIAQSQEISLIFYISPWNLDYVSKRLQGNSRYENCMRFLQSYMRRTQREHPGVYFQDFMLTDSLEGFSVRTAFYDKSHITPEAANTVIDNLAPVILDAVRLAMVRRSTEGDEGTQVVETLQAVERFEFVNDEALMEIWNLSTAEIGEINLTMDPSLASPVSSTRSVRLESYLPCNANGEPRFQFIQRGWAKPQDWSAWQTLELWLLVDDDPHYAPSGSFSVTLIEGSGETWQSTRSLESRGAWVSFSYNLTGSGVGNPAEHPDDFVIPDRLLDTQVNGVLDKNDIQRIRIQAISPTAMACGTAAVTEGKTYPDFSLWLDDIILK
jgi:hypothetical protein